MDPFNSGESRLFGRGRGRGRGVCPTTCLEIKPEHAIPSRGRGRGIQGAEAPCDPLPVSLADSPEEDDFLSAYRRLHCKDLPLGRGRGRGRGLPFSCPSESDSGYQSRANVSPVPSPVPPTLSSRKSGIFEEIPVIKHGEKGRPVSLIANFLKLSVATNMGIYEYHVDFEPAVESFSVKKKIINGLKQKLGTTTHSFDGSKLYLAEQLIQTMSEFSVSHPRESSKLISVKLKFVKQNTLTECVHFYNVLFRRIMEILGLVEMKRNFYDYRAVHDFPLHKLEIWPGYVTAVDEYEGGLMLCCDSSFRVLRQETILEKLENFHHGGWTVENSKQAFINYVLGKIVLTKYNNRNYRIDDVDWSNNPASTFINSKGEEMTYIKYYKDAYDISIVNLKQPLLIHRPKPLQQKGPVPLICLIPELCYVTGLDSEITSNYAVMKDLAVFTKLTPAQRNVALQKFALNINECPEAKSVLDMWGLSLKEVAVKLQGRVLTIPQISLNRTTRIHPDKANFSNEVMSNSVYDPVAVRSWQLFFSSGDRGRANQFIDIYQQVTRPFGIPMSSNTGQMINVGKGNVKDFHSALERHLNLDVQFVVVILPTQRDDLYSTVKKMCTLKKPIPSQVILSKTLGNERKIRSIVQKIALQINCKIGGSLWAIPIPIPEKIMFFGMDVYHDPRKKSCSVTGIVATVNTSFTKYYSRVIIQGRHQETINSLLPIFVDALTLFAEENNGFPDRVIVWRDGVGDGQLTYTKEHEAPQITGAFKNLSINPKFTFCVVQKRINARLFLQGSHGSVSNPEPGTVMDHTITRKFLYDFFLVSQLVRDGTVTPTHFVVVEDTANVLPDVIQKFAFATSFMYYNWCGSIRVPAMCQYAHKLASLVGQSTHEEPKLELAKNLYYL